MGTSMQAFKRPEAGFRFKYSGTKVNAPADFLPPDKYAMGINVRGYNDDTTRSRPGMDLRTNCGQASIAAICAYQPLQTNPALANPPRYLATDRNGAVWLDNSNQIGALASSPDATIGASMIAFRPNQSPNPYIYIGSAYDYQKFSAPIGGGPVTQSKVGIAEPQNAPTAGLAAQSFTQLLSPNGAWSTGGTAANYSKSLRSNDIVASSLQDPFRANRYSIQVSPAVSYQRGEIAVFQPSGAVAPIEEVLPPLAISMTVAGIFYDAQSATGHCIVVPSGVNAKPGQLPEDAPDAGTNSPEQSAIAVLQHGSLIKIGNEVCYVWSVINGPSGQIAIETSTVAIHAAGESVIGVSTIIVNNVIAAWVAPGVTILGDSIQCSQFQVTSGVGTLTAGANGGSGSIVARPTTILNGWGPNGHKGLYEGGVSQGYSFGFDGSTTQPYANPQLAYDGSLATSASSVIAHSHAYAGCVWGFPATTPGATGLSLNINSAVPATTAGGGAITQRSSSIFYSLDGGLNWILVYDSPAVRAQQWDTIPLPFGQNTSLVQVMAFTDSHDDFAHQVFEINLTATSNSAAIGGSTGAYTGDDYLHFSLFLDNPINLSEFRLILDVSDGTFSRDYFYASITPSYFSGATNGLTPSASTLSAIQQQLQSQQVVDEAKGTGLTASQPTVAGTAQWTEVFLPISELTRVGGDQTKTLANIVGLQAWVAALGNMNVQVSSIMFVGGAAPDVGDAGAPYQYRVRPRSSVTGVIGNPSPATRYGVNARRQVISVILPPAPDPQADIWDIFRYGGSVTSWRFCGSVPAFGIGATGEFVDTFDDAAVGAGDALDFDNFEPWPTVDIPLNAPFTQVTGTIAIVGGSPPGQSNWARYLPGNLVKLSNGNVYTLRSRPTFYGIGGTTWRFELEQNAGVMFSTTFSIYEPMMARQSLPYLWGTDDNGVVFGCGDPLRPGTLYFSKPNNLDSAPDKYNIEITQPTEPLLGGEVLDGTSYVATPKRWWRLYPQLDNPLQRYRPVQEPLPRGLAAPFGHCNDGQALYWWADDGIYSSAQGSLTDADLYTLFPHNGVVGVDQTYNGFVYKAPDYSRSATFRLSVSNGFVYADYQDTSGNYNTLTLELRTGAWTRDQHNPIVTIHYAPPTVSGTLVSPGQQTPKLFDVLLQGTVPTPSFQVPGSTLIPQRPGVVTIPAVPARISAQQDKTNDLDGPISVVLATREFDAGDVRSDEQWGDFYVDCIPSAAVPMVFGKNGILVTPMSLGVPVAQSLVIPTSAARTQSPLSLGGALSTNFLGFMFQWIDDFTKQSNPTTLFVWQPSYIDKPETITDRFTDWDNAGTAGAKFFQGFLLHADTFDAVKPILVRDAESELTHSFTPVVQHDGEATTAYSFDTPFVAHLVRFEPQGQLPWRFFDVQWIYELTPEAAQTWITQPATHGLKGYMHLRQISLQFISFGPVTLVITAYDGQSPLPIAIPSTGRIVKMVFPVSANKGQNFTYAFTSPQPFAIYKEQCEVLVGQWDRGQARYTNAPLVGGPMGENARV